MKERTPDHVQFECGLDRPGCVKINADGSGTVTLSFPTSELEHITRLGLMFREKTLLATILAKETTFGKKAE